LARKEEVWAWKISKLALLVRKTGYETHRNFHEEVWGSSVWRTCKISRRKKFILKGKFESRLTFFMLLVNT
jgi:hypothetical protein